MSVCLDGVRSVDDDDDDGYFCGSRVRGWYGGFTAFIHRGDLQCRSTLGLGFRVRV